MHDLATTIRYQLEERDAQGRLRRLKSFAPADGAHVLVDQRPMVNFASNDYLGLSQHPALKQRAIEYINRYGVGSTASRLLCGNIDAYERIERKLASLKGTQAALILPSGFQTNVTVLSALAGTKSLIACDRLSHNSLLQGAQLSGSRWVRYQHNNAEHLQKHLDETTGRFAQRWIVTESVFSMDGDRAPIDTLAEMARTNDAHLFVDEAHATGLLGEFGMGLTAGSDSTTLAMGTFGKGCGSFGAYVACSNELRDYLVNFCAGFVYSTGLPPPVLGAIDAALDVIPTMEKNRQELLSNAELLRTKLRHMGYDTLDSSTQIIPIVIGDEQQTIALGQYLQDGGIFAAVIRPPTVPDGMARIRLSLTSLHTNEHLDRVVNLLRSWRAH